MIGFGIKQKEKHGIMFGKIYFPIKITRVLKRNKTFTKFSVHWSLTFDKGKYFPNKLIFFSSITFKTLANYDNNVKIVVYLTLSRRKEVYSILKAIICYLRSKQWHLLPHVSLSNRFGIYCYFIAIDLLKSGIVPTWVGHRNKWRLN